MTNYESVAQAKDVDRMIEESSQVLKQIVSDFEEIIKLDVAEERYLGDERLSEQEKRRIKELKGRVMTIEEGLTSKQFSNYADFVSFIDNLSSHMIESIKYELIIEGDVTDVAEKTKQDLMPEHEDLLVQIHGDALEILDDLDHLLEAIEEFAERKDIESYEQLSVAIKDVEKVKNSISNYEDVIMEEARKLGIADEL